MQIKVIVNGEEKLVTEGTNVQEILELLGLQLRGTAVELNGEVVTRGRYIETTLRESDRVEIIQMVGGG